MGATYSTAAALEQHNSERASSDGNFLAAAVLEEEEVYAFEDAVENLTEEDAEENGNVQQQNNATSGPVLEYVEQNIMDGVAEELDGIEEVVVVAVVGDIGDDDAGALAVPRAFRRPEVPGRAHAQARRRRMRDLAAMIEADPRRGGNNPRAAAAAARPLDLGRGDMRNRLEIDARLTEQEARRSMQVLDRELERMRRAHLDMVANMDRIMDQRINLPRPPAAAAAPPPPVVHRDPPRVHYKKSLENGFMSWANVPQDLREDESFARSITTLPNIRVLRAIFDAYPALAQDRYYWKKIFDGNTVVREGVSDLFASSANQAMLNDGELMRAACKKSPRFQQIMEKPRANDRYFWKVLLDEDPFVLRNLPFSIQRRYPDLVLDAIAVLGRIPLPKEDMHMIYELTPNMVPEFWHDRENLRKWFTSGLPFREWRVRLPGALKHDKTVFRWIAEHCRSSLKVDSFDVASTALRSDKTFMLECVTFDPRVLKCAIGPLRTDFDLALAACAGPRELVAIYLEEVRFRAGQAKFMREFHPRVRNMVHSNKSFHPVVLQGMTSCSGSPLGMLNENVKKVIAEEFLDVSTTAAQAKFVGPAAENLDAIRGVPT